MNVLDKFQEVFNFLLTDKKIIRKFLIETKKRRIDARIFDNILSQNILNRYKANFQCSLLSNWQGFTLLLILYSIKNNIITNEEGDLLIYNINRYLFNYNLYYIIQYDFTTLCGISSEIEYNFFQFILAIVIENKYDYKFIYDFLDGIDDEMKDKLITYIYKNNKERYYEWVKNNI